MSSKMGYPYRVFLCFSTDDSETRNIVHGHLHSLGLNVCWSGELLAGTRFAEQIRDGISRAHLFIPILTASALARPWVHQEIGFALGQNVPIIPLAIGVLPPGLAEELQAVSLDCDGSTMEAELQAKLTFEKIEQLIKVKSHGKNAVFQSAELHEDRTRMLIEAAQHVLQLSKPAKICQSGAFSSFSLPQPTPTEEFWEVCDGKGPKRCPALKRDLPLERYFLEQHALSGGCDLMLNPSIPLSIRGDQAKKLRLEILNEFLKKMLTLPKPNLRAVIVEESRDEGNLLFVGDWFMAESIMPSPGFGYRQTLGTWHAPTILHRLQQFERDFNRLWDKDPALTAEQKNQSVIDRIQAIIHSL